MSRAGAGRPSGRRRWGLLLLVALLVVPTLEIALIVTIGSRIGVLPTLVLLLVESALGAWIVRREGSRAWRALSGALTSGRMPAGELSDAALVLVGGTLLLTPGFLTDVAGFVFVLPLTRPIARRLLVRAVERRLLGAVLPSFAGGAAGRRPTRADDVPSPPWGAGEPSPGPAGPGGGPVVQGRVVDPPPDRH